MFQLFFTLSLIAAVFGGTNPQIPRSWHDRIVGGEETSIDEFPYQVSVRFNVRHLCGGSIINARTVVTAAHCTNVHTASELHVRVGTSYSDNVADNGTLYSIEKIIQHEGFMFPTIDNDISLLLTSRSIEFSSKIQPIALLQNGIDVPANQIVTVTGWGATQERGRTVNLLRKVDLIVLETEKCINSYGNRITERMFCAQAPGKDACQGDSGGPVAYQGHLVGIVSWGRGCARPEYPGVFTRIASLRPWIDEHIPG